MADQEVKVKITCDSSGAVTGIDLVKTKMGEIEKASSSFATKVKAHWLAFSAAVAGAMLTMSQAMELIKQGAEYAEQKGILDNLAQKYKATADGIVACMEKASEGLIAKSELMKVALAGIAKGLTPEQLTNLADAAKILGDTVGVSATQALNDLTTALESNRTKGLKTFLGSAVDLEKAFGDLSSKMTEAEKTQALYSLVMIDAINKQRQQTKSVDETADRVESLDAKWKNLKQTIAGVAKQGFDSIGTGLGGMIQLWQIMSSKKPQSGPGVYEVPAIANNKTTNPYEAQIASLKKMLQARSNAEAAGKKAATSAESLQKSWVDTKSTLETDIAKSGLDEFDAKLLEITANTEKLLAKYKSIPGAANLIKAAQDAQINTLTTEYARKDFEELQRLDKETARSAQQAAEKRIEAARRVYEETRTPEEKYQEEIAKLNDLLDGGEISFETYERAAKKAMEEMGKSANGVDERFRDLKQTIEGWGKDSANAIADFALYGKTSFTGMIDSMISDLLRMMIYQNITGPLFSAASQGLSGLLSNMFSPAAAGGTPSGMAPLSSYTFGSAHGNVFAGGNLIPFARGGVVNTPTIFPLARGAGLMGEAGPEAVMPLTRLSSGDLGVKAAGGGGNVTVNVINNNNSAVDTKMRETANGPELDVIIDQAVAKKIGTYGSGTNKIMRQNFGARGRLVNR